MKKDEIRKQYIEKRKEIKQKEEKSNKIIQTLLHQSCYQYASRIGVYASLQEEVQTDYLLQYAITQGKIIGIPYVQRKSTMEFYKMNSLEELKQSAIFHLRQPMPKKETKMEAEQFDLLIIPGVCFDENKNRIGFGKGYYDRYLAKCLNKVIKIGLAFEEQICPFIPSEKTDIGMDYVITENRVIR